MTSACHNNPFLSDIEKQLNITITLRYTEGQNKLCSQDMTISALYVNEQCFVTCVN